MDERHSGDVSMKRAAGVAIRSLQDIHIFLQTVLREVRVVGVDWKSIQARESARRFLTLTFSHKLDPSRDPDTVDPASAVGRN